MKTGISGILVEILPEPGGRAHPLDGFLVAGNRRRPALVLLHGMYSNFYRSAWKKAVLRECAKRGLAALSFNNRGAETGTSDERFSNCLRDISSAIGLMQKNGYRRVVLVGHSTGCQKATYYQAVRQDRRVVGLALLAIGDDLAIVRRDLGKEFSRWVRIAKRRVSSGHGDKPLGAPHIPPFSARRFLSIADAASVEARLFDFSNDGPRGWFERIRCPVLCVLAENDEYETTPPNQMIRQLANRYCGKRFDSAMIHGADHGFHGHERVVAETVLKWVERLVPQDYR